MIKLPHVTLKLVNAETQAPIVDQNLTVRVSQDKWGDGMKELFHTHPDPRSGTVDWEASSFTKYRIVADGAFWKSNEMLIDTGFNIATPINTNLNLKPDLNPLPSFNPFTNLSRDVGLAQQMPFVIMLIAIAAIIGFVVYGGTKVLAVIPHKK